MSAFNRTFNDVAESIVTAATVFTPVSLTDKSEKPDVFQTQNALWDTGATQSMVSTRVIDKLKLRKCGEVEVTSIDSTTIQNTYLAHLCLPDGTLIPNIELIENKEIDCDVLIGMDVITASDFCISYKNGQTLFSYRFPAEGVLLK